MRQELYIDGVLVDIDDKTSVTTSFNSNLFRDVSQMVGNNTYTVQLPLTTHNRKLIQIADTIPARSPFPYVYHTAKYIRDGVTIIENGYAVLMGIGERIEVVITWGVSAALSDLITGEALLNSLQSDATLTWTEHPVVTKWSVFDADDEAVPYFFAYADYNKPLESSDEWQEVINHGWVCPYLRPVVRVPWLLRLIAEQYGVTFDFSADADAQAFINTLVIPLTNDKPTELTSVPDVITLQGQMPIGRESIFSFTSDNGGGIFNAVSGTATRLSVSQEKDVTFAFDVEITTPVNDGYVLVELQTSFKVQLFDSNNNEVDDASLTLPFKIFKRTEAEAVLRAQGTIDVSLESGWSAGLRLVWEAAVPITSADVGQTFMSNLLAMHPEVKANGSEEHVQFGQEYPIAANLPAIKVVDFIKALAVLTGTWPVQPKGNSVTFLPLSWAWERKDYAEEWTRKVIPSYEMERPRSMSFSMSGYARRNWYKWKDVGDYEGQADGALTIQNATLDKEREVFTMPFGVPAVDNRGAAHIPIYEVSNYDKLVDGAITPTYDIDKAGDYLCVAMPKRNQRHISGGGNNPDVQIGTDGLNLQTIIEEKYGNIVAALSQAVVVKERVRLSDVELMNFDGTTPVYLAQYGTYFAVLSLQGAENGTAEAELLAMITPTNV